MTDKTKAFVIKPVSTVRQGWVSAGCADHLAFDGGIVRRLGDGSLLVQNRTRKDVDAIADQFHCKVQGVKGTVPTLD